MFKLINKACLTVLALMVTTGVAQAEPPPWADTFQAAENFLACGGNPYALCYYSGPDFKTPRHAGQDVPHLPCKVEGGHAAECTCYAITERLSNPAFGKAANALLDYNYVLISAILKEQVRDQTEAQCGTDGSGCLNMKNLLGCLHKIETGGPIPLDCRMAPVCYFLGNIDSGTPQTLYPDQSDTVLISTFSFANVTQHNFGSTDCSDYGEEAGYAGCMTAPCTADENGLTTCTCPTYKGPFQIGQTLNGGQPTADLCGLSDNTIWSAAENLNVSTD